MRNGNTKKVRNICNTLHRLYGGEVSRKQVIEAAVRQGVPENTASDVWQQWRQQNGNERKPHVR